MSETDDFLSTTLPRQMIAERALHDGDVEPRLAMWTRNEPVTVFGAWLSDSGWEDVLKVFRGIATRFSNCTSYEFELIAAGAIGDMAYMAGFEHTSCSINGEPRTYTLRATHVYRREDGEWKIVHRHGDEVVPITADQEAATAKQV
jgi:ketosteroid isomerase-like protein